MVADHKQMPTDCAALVALMLILKYLSKSKVLSWWCHSWWSKPEDLLTQITVMGSNDSRLNGQWRLQSFET